ncbi:hypothetical protein CYLTODRAFT_458964 [Cylindrobasidium torrendii FP15055 ss-10]|uniref:Protein kinase domain-containing protein n=1 Tax=Cylindrobasidium torrendii FP15055 ss-10 TaxID=1314674 RepID=A0A0D7AW86_9AGAR|nr:hypothetical protein CYLTODRAFT_458964 [Cylindrobasidium torrendii FP15055 ss-10]
MSKVISTPLINKLSNPRQTYSYFDIFSEAQELELAELTCSTPLLANITNPRIILRQLCRWSNDEADVYYGKLEDGGSYSIDITVKIGGYYPMANKALQYRSMHTLWGKSILICHGLYALAVSRGRQLGVLILERFGSLFDDYFVRMSRVEKTALLNQLLEIHSLGKSYSNLWPRNVLESDFCSGDLRLIDFADIESDHKCRCASHPEKRTFRFKAEDAKRHPWEFPAVCPNILRIAANMNYWDYGVAVFAGFEYEVDDVPSARIMYLLPEGISECEKGDGWVHLMENNPMSMPEGW